MEVNTNIIKSKDSDVVKAEVFVSDKIKDLELQSLRYQEEKNLLNIEHLEMSKYLEKLKQKRDVNLSLFSPYASNDLNKDDKKYFMKVEENEQRIAELNILIEKKRGEIEQYYILETLIRERISLENELKIFANNHVDKDNIITKQDTKSVGKIGKMIINAQELERKRIARDLHDTTVQNLTALVHKTELCAKLIDIDSIRIRLELVSMAEVLRNTINDMRTIIYDLRPMSLNDLGLIPTIELLLKDIKNKNHLQTSLTVNNKRRCMNATTNLTLYRVIQEACNNVIKHANASTIQIVITYFNDELQLVIKDDGIGFNMDNVINENSNDIRNFGLSIMKERVYLLSGNISFEATDQQGTKINIVVPYCNNEEEDTK